MSRFRVYAYVYACLGLGFRVYVYVYACLGLGFMFRFRVNLGLGFRVSLGLGYCE